MKNEIRNIINLENITKLRNSINVSANMPGKNSIVKIIPIEYLEKGVKVLIDGKLFIAFIEGKLPLKEEIIAVVLSSSPFTISLSLTDELSNNNKILIDHVIKKLELKNSDLNRKLIIKIIEEGNVIIKSKYNQLIDLLNYVKVNGLELSLLINLVWNNNDKSRQFIDELYSGLFNETFKDVTKTLFDTINELLFSNLPQYLSRSVREKLIYNSQSANIGALVDKSKDLYEIIKLLNDYRNSHSEWNDKLIPNFILYSTKYILQKSVLKEYDYYPDFVLVQKGTELEIINYSIKKIYGTKKEISYRVIFAHDSLPFELKGLIRNNFFIGDIDIPEKLTEKEEVLSIEDRLKDNWGINSDLKLNRKDKSEFVSTKLNKKLNKLIS